MGQIFKRKVNGQGISDPANIENMTFSEKSGARKSTEVGRKLVPIPITNGSTWTTDASTARALPNAGRNLAIYNNSATLYSVTFGASGSVTAQAAGAVDSNGNAGIPCMPNSWTYVAAGESQWVITQNAALLVFLIDDDTFISIEATK